MTLSELCEKLGGKRAGGWDDPGTAEVVGISLDSREVGEGMVFFAVQGETDDGHRFIRDAEAKGALAAIVEKEDAGCGMAQVVVKDSRRAAARGAAIFYGRPSKRMPVIGVTGTNGKTTVTYLIRDMFGRAGKRMGLLGTVEYDLVSRSIESRTTTPDPVSVQRDLSEMFEAGARGAVMEVSSHALAQGRVGEVEFAAGVFTNLGRDHLDYHGTLGAYREAKAELFKMLGSEAVAVLNAEDEASETFRKITRARVCTYGMEKGELRARVKELSLTGSEYELLWEGQGYAAKSPLVGEWNVRNALAASRTALALGLEMDVVLGSIADFDGVPGRLERVEGAEGFHVFVDYAHTPDALEAVLSSVKPLAEDGRLLLVFGCGGDRDRGKRPVMGAVAERHADRIWLTADNSRSEDTRAIIGEIEAGIRRRSMYKVVPDRASAIDEAVLAAGDGDIVIIAGKGHETYQILGDNRLHFDDRLVAREAIRRKSGD